MVSEETLCRLAKVRRATSVGAPPGSACSRWAREVPPSSREALAEAEAILAQAMPRPPQTIVFDEWTEKSPPVRQSPRPAAAALRSGTGRWRRSAITAGGRPSSVPCVACTVPLPRHGWESDTDDTLTEQSLSRDQLRHGRSRFVHDAQPQRRYTFYEDFASCENDGQDTFPPPPPPPPAQHSVPTTPPGEHLGSGDTGMQPHLDQFVHVPTSQPYGLCGNDPITARQADAAARYPEDPSATQPWSRDEKDAHTSTDRMTALLAEAEALLRETAEAAAPFFGGTAAWAFDSPSEAGNYPSSAGQPDTATHYPQEPTATQPRSASAMSEASVAIRTEPVGRRWGQQARMVAQP